MEISKKVDIHRAITWIDDIDQENFNRVINKMTSLLKKMRLTQSIFLLTRLAARHAEPMLSLILREQIQFLFIPTVLDLWILRLSRYFLRE